MATLTISHIDDDVALRLRTRAEVHGRSVEAEARAILIDAVGGATAAPVVGNIADSIRAIMMPLGGVDLVAFPDEYAPEPPRLD